MKTKQQDKVKSDTAKKKIFRLTGSNCPHKNKRIMINSNADFCLDCGEWI